jgi:hypothetical protein
MNRLYRFVLLLISIAVVNTKAFCQNDTVGSAKVAIFIPLYADEVFDGITYTTGKPTLPKTSYPDWNL